MKRIAFAALLVFVLGAEARAAEVALSFEDAPGPTTPLLGADRTKQLIAGLRRSQVDQAIFFAVGKYVDAQGPKRLKQYAEAGHVIGSQGYSLQTVDQLGATEFIKDMKHNDLVVKDLPGFKMWFRFPELNQGSTTEARDNVREWIYHMLYGRSHATINTPDQQLDALVQQGVAEGRRFDSDKLKALYVSVMMQCLDHYDQLARSVVGASPRHMLRLHENDLAALYVGDLVQAIRASGSAVVKATDAFNDEFNRHEVDMVPLTGSQILAVAKERGFEGAAPAAIEDPARLKQALDAAAIWE